MGSVNFQIKKMSELYASLHDVNKLTSPEFYTQLTGKQLPTEKAAAQKKLELACVISRLQKYIEKTLQSVAQQTPGNSLHLIKDKRNLIQVLDSIESDLDQLIKKIRPPYFKYLYDSLCIASYNATKQHVFDIQKKLKEKIKEIEQDSATLFEKALSRARDEISASIQQINDAYLVKAMGITKKVDVLSFQNKTEGLNAAENAALIHEIVIDQLKKQTVHQLKLIGNPGEFKNHIQNVTKVLQNSFINLTNNKLYYDLSNTEKAQKINAAMPNLVGVKDSLQIDTSILEDNIKKIFTEPFEDRERAEKALFRHSPVSLLDTIKKILSIIKVYIFENPIINKNSKEIQLFIYDRIKKYYGKADSEKREDLFIDSQVVKNDLIRELQQKFKDSSILQEEEEEKVGSLFTERSLINQVDRELLNQLSFRSKRNEQMRFEKICRDINSTFIQKTKELNAEQKNGKAKSILHYQKVEILLDSYTSISEYIKNKKFLSMLSSISIKEENKEFLEHLWKYLLISSYPRKSMGQRRITACYRDYLMIKEHVPKHLKDELELFSLDYVETIHKGSDIHVLLERYPKALTKAEMENIEILSCAFEGKALSKAQERKISEFINSAAGNIRINKLTGARIDKKNGDLYDFIQYVQSFISGMKLGEILAKKVEAFLGRILLKLKVAPQVKANQRHKAAMTFLHYFSWKTRNLDIAEKIYGKLEANLHLLQKGKPIAKNQKLTLKEYSLLRDVIRLSDFIKKNENIAIKKIISNNQKFNEKIFELAKKSETIKTKIEELYHQEAVELYKSGDIAAKDSYKFEELMDSKNDLENKLLKKFISKYKHCAVIINTGLQLFCSEVIKEYRRDYKFHVDEALFNDVWRVDPSQLLEGINLHYIIEMYKEQGKKDWRKEIQTEFSVISNGIHARNFSNLVNNKNKRVWAGIADFVPFAHKGLRTTNWKEKVSQKLFPQNPFLRDLKKIRNWMWDCFGIPHEKNYEGKPMTCSSFTTNTTILSLAELNEALAKKLVQHFKAKKNQELEIYFANKKEVFTLPYPTDLKLSTVHPGMMIDLLKKKKCLKKIEPPLILQKLFIE